MSNQADTPGVEVMAPAPHAISGVDYRTRVAEVSDGVRAVTEIMNTVMVNGEHYGTIPGTGDRPVLFLSGAEKISAVFSLTVDPEVFDLSSADRDVVHYRVKTRVTNRDGTVLGSAWGEASSEEDKYKWRACYINEEWDATPDSRRSIKFTQYKGSPTKMNRRIRTNPADIQNTVLKMAVKRSVVAAILGTTGARDLFTQDLEDLPEELRTAEEKAMGKTQAKAHRTRDDLKITKPSYEKLSRLMSDHDVSEESARIWLVKHRLPVPVELREMTRGAYERLSAALEAMEKKEEPKEASPATEPAKRGDDTPPSDSTAADADSNQNAPDDEPPGRGPKPPEDTLENKVDHRPPEEQEAPEDKPLPDMVVAAVDCFDSGQLPEVMSTAYLHNTFSVETPDQLDEAQAEKYCAWYEDSVAATRLA